MASRRSSWFLCLSIVFGFFTLVSLTLIAQPAAQKAQHAFIVFNVRDVTTGYAVQAEVSFTRVDSGQGSPVTAQTDSQRLLRMDLPAGRYTVRVTAPAYKPMQFDDNTQPSPDASKLRVMLAGTTDPEQLRPEVLDPQLRDGYILLYGYIVDDDTGRPLSGVQVRFEKLGVVTSTNARGYFGRAVQLPPLPPYEGIEDNVSFELQGYKTQVHENQLLPNSGWIGFPIGLQRGGGVDRRNVRHHLMEKGAEEFQEQKPTPAAPQEQSSVTTQSATLSARITGKPETTNREPPEGTFLLGDHKGIARFPRLSQGQR
jgi:hypothetical protein